MDTQRKTIGELLGAYNLSEVARRLGVNTKTVWGWKHGRSIPSAHKLIALAEFLGVDASSIDLSPSHADPHRDTTLTSRGGRRGVQQRAS